MIDIFNLILWDGQWSVLIVKYFMPIVKEGMFSHSVFVHETFIKIHSRPSTDCLMEHIVMGASPQTS